jgi:hypothetical protein
MGNPGDNASEDPAGPPWTRCSFCLRGSEDVGLLIEGLQPNELGPAYICYGCVQLCAMIFESREISASEDEGADNAIMGVSRDFLEKEIDKRLEALTQRERDVIKLRCGLGDSHLYTLDEICQRFQLTLNDIREIEVRAVAILQGGPRGHGG